MFLNTGQAQRCDLAERFGCRFTRKGAVWTGQLEITSIPGIYAAGDASRDVQLAIVAAAEGAKAAIAMNMKLQEEDQA
jgi:thioredoxin reductase